MKAAFVDTSVFLHAFGAEHSMRHTSRQLIEWGSDEGLLHAGAETIQEFAYHRMRVSARLEAVALTQKLMSALMIHPFDEVIASRALDLMAATMIGGRDAVLAATALEAGFDRVVTHDRRWSTIPGLQPVSAADFLADL